jgi:hypothetical protein
MGRYIEGNRTKALGVVNGCTSVSNDLRLHLLMNILLLGGTLINQHCRSTIGKATSTSARMRRWYCAMDSCAAL